MHTHTPVASAHQNIRMHAQLFGTRRQLLLWHILYVNHACRVPVDSPQRFRIELLFSPGASFNPYEVVPLHKDHTLPVQPRACLHKGGAALHKLLHLVGNATLLLFSAFVKLLAKSPAQRWDCTAQIAAFGRQCYTLAFSCFRDSYLTSPLLQQASLPAMSKRRITQCLCIRCYMEP